MFAIKRYGAGAVGHPLGFRELEFHIVILSTPDNCDIKVVWFGALQADDIAVSEVGATTLESYRLK